MRLQIDKLGKVAITVEQGYWNINKDYDKLTVVQVENEYATFISRKPVPAGTVLTDRKYWIPFSSLKEELIINYNKFVDNYNSILKNHADILDNHNIRLIDLENLKSTIERYILTLNTKTEEIDNKLVEVNKLLASTEVLVNSFKNNIENLTNKINKVVDSQGQPNGIATLNDQGHIPSNQLPSYIDDVIEYVNKDEFPAEGESGKIYVSTEKNTTYRWSGTTYIAIGSSLALGTTSETAYPGDKGKEL